MNNIVDSIRNIDKMDENELVKVIEEINADTKLKKKQIRYINIDILDFVSLIKNGEVIKGYNVLGDITAESIADIVKKEEFNGQLYIEYPILVRNCIFGNIHLPNIHFKDKFEIRVSQVDYINVAKSVFDKAINFSTTKFVKVAKFNDCWFNHNAYFSDTVFECEANFWSVNFKEYAFYHNAYFKNNASFRMSYFRNKTIFSGVISEFIDFGSCKFFDSFVINNFYNLVYTDDGNKLKGQEELIFNGAQFYGNVNFSNLKCRFLDLSTVESKSLIDMNNVEFEMIDIYQFDFVRCIIEPSQLVDNVGKYKFDKSNDHDAIRQFFNKLKVNYQNMQMYENEDWAYRAFKREETNLIKENNLIKFYIRNCLLDGLLGYGTKPLGAFFAATLSIGLYFMLYLIFGINREMDGLINGTISFREVGNYLYFTLITFTTIGYGEITPNGFMKIVAASEGFVGIFVTAIFTVIFSRKIIR